MKRGRGGGGGGIKVKQNSVRYNTNAAISHKCCSITFSDE